MNETEFKYCPYLHCRFEVVNSTGEITLSDCGRPTCLDYEAQKSYSLTYEAEDGGGRITTVNLFIEVSDVNDNAPQFTKEVYTHEVLENTGKLLPPLFIKVLFLLLHVLFF